MANPMEQLLDKILDSAEPPGEAAVVLHLRDAPMPASGALRRHEISGMFELLVMAQNDTHSQPYPVSLFFSADGVSRVMIPRKEIAPKVSSPSGLIIPSG